MMPRRLALLLLALASVMAAGCFNPFDPRISALHVASAPAPVPNSPANVVRLFAWCWAHRDPDQYAEVFTDDYRFIFAPNDSAGNPYRDRPWLREDEMASAQHLFIGGTDRPPASEIDITIDNALVALPDPRPGFGDTRYHQTIRTNVNLEVKVDENGSPDVSVIAGTALFYIVRGDSAAIPAELKAKGFLPDSTRWWISRWEDETAGAVSGGSLLRPAPPPDGARAALTRLGLRSPGARPAGSTLDPEQPYTRQVTWGELKAEYHDNAP